MIGTENFSKILFSLIALALLVLAGEVSAQECGQSFRERTSEIKWRRVHQPRSATALLYDHRARIKNKLVMLPEEIPIEFEGNDPATSLRTHYNPTGPFQALVDGKILNIFGTRDESLRSEFDSEVGFYVENAHGRLTPYRPAGLEPLKLQDPFVSQIAGETVLGGVKVQRGIGHHTEFYRDLGLGLSSLIKAFDGPPDMKDIRLVGTLEHKVLAFTRPQGRRKGGRGKVGFEFFDNLDALSAEVLQNAPLIEGQFLDEEWGGVNHAELLSNGLIGVIGHIARYTERGTRQYYVVSWAFNPYTLESTEMEIIFAREDLPGGLYRGHKREDLKNVVFPAKLVRLKNGTAILYGGEGDRRCFASRITDPLTKYEAIILRHLDKAA
jgi:hypothetical protein